MKKLKELAGKMGWTVKEVDEFILELKQRIDTGGTTDCSVDDVEKRITLILTKIGMPCNIKGFGYVREGIRGVLEDPSLMNNLVKELYPMLARNFDTTPSRVERAIRHAIEVVFDRCSPDILISLFGNTIDSSRGKATNGNFIATIAEFLRYDMDLE